MTQRPFQSRAEECLLGRRKWAAWTPSDSSDGANITGVVRPPGRHASVAADGERTW